ncbi:MAG: dipeptidase [Phycisphaerae bacterium]|jgi:acetylornithine deacetylase/succinyl-diaminopimelate desuccinylase-like protein|nr:dipeptidase [Phycisphaerae bacterium]MDP7636574.1 dipeptidase [Phycisphaerae bacterium]
MIPSGLTEYLQAHRQEHLASLKEFLRFPSVANVTSQPDHCEQCAQWLGQYLRDLGMTVRIVPTGNKPNILAKARASDSAPTLLIYGHYDVQPPDPLGQWQSDPFEPEVRDGYLYARGADDDKGQFFTHLMAAEAWQRAGGGLPLNLKVFVEGEEEIGSPDLEAFVGAHADELAADAVVISDSSFFAAGVPSITYALRGLACVELSLTGPAADVHSGIHGGAMTNPINALAKLIAGMHDAAGRVTLPGFYHDVVELSPQERDQWASLPFDEAQYAASLGVDRLGGGEAALSVMERRWSRPTLDCNGIVGGYTEKGTKTIIPSTAATKISMRLVPHQDPERVADGLREYLRQNVPPGVTWTLDMSAGARPVLLNHHSPTIQAARDAMAEAFDRKVAMIRSGASVPVTELFQRILALEPALMGFGLPDDRLHSPNERFALEQLWGGSLASAAFMQNLATSLQG